MTWSVVSSLTVASIAATIDVNDESIGSNTGTPVLLTTITKPETGSDSWGGLDPHVSVSNNSHSILTNALATINSTYSGKEINLDGIFIQEIET
jgi:hypothetical protein